MRPKFKPILKPLIKHGDALRIGYEGEVYDLEDPDGQIARFFDLLDGSRSLEELAASSDLTLEEVSEALATFDELGLLDDESLTDADLTARDLERYRANLNYFSNYSSLSQSKHVYQKRLQDATVAVLGLGGASLMVAALAGLGIGKIIGLDYDTVELSNLNRQFLYRERDIGQRKSDAVAEQVRLLNDDIEIETHNLKVSDAASLLDILQGADLVINGIDSPTILAMRWVNAACVRLGIPMLQGGIGNKSIIWQRLLPHTHGCYDCFLLHYLRLDPAFEQQLRAMYGLTFENRNTAIAPHVALLSGFVSAEVAKHFARYAEPMQPSTSIELNTTTMETKHFQSWDRYEECPTCGAGRHERDSIEPVSLEQLVEIAKEKVAGR